MSVLPGPDPTYAVIEGDPWLNDDPYWVMHRLAVAESGHGAGTRMLTWLTERHDNVRADTHADNVPMQRNAREVRLRPPRHDLGRGRHPADRVPLHALAENPAASVRREFCSRVLCGEAVRAPDRGRRVLG